MVGCGKTETAENNDNVNSSEIKDSEQPRGDVFYSGSCGETATWTIYKDGTLEISGTGEMDSSNPWLSFNSIINRITISDGINFISHYAFRNCYNVTTVYLGKVDRIGDLAFESCNRLQELYFSGDIADWCNIQFNSNYSNPLIFTHQIHLDGEVISEIIVPDTITEIKAYAFVGWSGKSIVIPDTITQVGNWAFWDCSIEEIKAPASAWTKINEMKSGSLKKAIVSSGWRIENNSFQGCSNLTNLSIADTIRVVGETAFNGCVNLSSVAFSRNLKTIEEGAFLYCSSLSEINFDGSIEQWGLVVKEDQWDYGTGNYAIICLDGTINK